MKIYTYYTQSHKILFDNWFSKTVVDLEIDATFGEQECATGSYYQDGWKKTTMKKVDIFIKACQENMNDIFVFSDVDIQFFGPIKEALLQELGDADIAIQNDYKGGLCSGFFICRGNERTLRMFQSMKQNESKYLEDQYALNMNLHYCNVKVLTERFWTFGSYGTQWKGQNFEIPNNLLMHHSNWTEGIENKIKLLEIIKLKNNLKQTVVNSTQEYQLFLNDYFKEFRPEYTYPTYPPYHTGKYLEQYFFETQKINKGIYYIPVDWTTCYIQNVNLPLLQEKILSLDKTKKYFTVSQHDDAIKEYFPFEVTKFCAGGNAGGIPIPLVCSPIPDTLIKQKERDIFCSFVGSTTHPIRTLMFQTLNNNPKYKFIIKQWTDTISESNMNQFMDITSRSIFTLCPRGYGRNSFRMYEAMQLGSIPVYIYDEDWRAFKDDVNWDDFSVSIHYTQLPNLDNILSKISSDNVKQMQENCIKSYNDIFSLESMSKKIISKI
jgi:Exostosin family/Nucleotide-diphospho-sugar transferase